MTSSPPHSKLGFHKKTWLFTGQDSARGSGQELFENSRAEWGRVMTCSKSHWSGRIGEDVFKFQGSGRVGSGRFSSGHPDPIRPARRDLTGENLRENIYVVADENPTE